jgi:hypothetical protein
MNNRRYRKRSERGYQRPHLRLKKEWRQKGISIYSHRKQFWYPPLGLWLVRVPVSATRQWDVRVYDGFEWVFDVMT